MPAHSHLSRTPLREKNVINQSSPRPTSQYSSIAGLHKPLGAPSRLGRTLSACQNFNIRAKAPSESTLKRTSSACQNFNAKAPKPILETPPPSSRNDHHVEHWANNIGVSSELPPSSPPSTSSAPLFNLQNAPDNDFTLDAKRDSDDPFGFFAAERRLKERRAVEAPLPVQPFGSEAGEDDGLGPEAFATPHHDTSFEEEEKGGDSPTTPRTPTKRLGKRKAVGSPTSSRAPSLPSTPSPSKRPIRAEDSSQDTPEQHATPEDDGRTTRMQTKKAKTQATGGKKRKGLRADISVDSDDPKAYSLKLEALLPRRPNRNPQPARSQPARSRRAASHRSAPAGLDDDKDDQPSTKNRPVTRARKPRSTAKKVVVEDEGAAEEFEDEEFIKARDARIEYFKKLKNYKVATEDVYVV